MLPYFKLTITYFFLGPIKRNGWDDIKLTSISPLGERAKPGKWQGEGLQLAKSSSAGLGVTKRSSAPTPTDSGWSLVFPTPSLTKVPQQLGLSSSAQPFHILKVQRTSPQVSHVIPAWALCSHLTYPPTTWFSSVYFSYFSTDCIAHPLMNHPTLHST